MTNESLKIFDTALNSVYVELLEGVKYPPKEFNGVYKHIQDVIIPQSYTDFRPTLKMIAGACRVRLVDGLRKYEYYHDGLFSELPSHILHEKLKIDLKDEKAICISLYDILNYLSYAYTRSTELKI